MTQRRSVVLCDDDFEAASGWREELESLDEVAGVFDVTVVEREVFERDLQLLEGRRKSLREKETPQQEATIFDSAAILIVDYDLYGYKPEQLLTGDSIAYLARSFSSCGYIVGVNQDRIPNPFDLTLISHRSVSTDLSIGSEQVAARGLWSGDHAHWDPFRPWYWPVLPERATALSRLGEMLIGRLDEPLADVLGLPRELLDSLPRSVMALLDVPDRPDIGDVALREWVHTSQMGLRPGDLVSDESQIARVAAARLAKWFERVLLPGQDILVDAPHLVDRRPGLLQGDTTDPESWQRTTCLGLPPEELGLDTERIAGQCFQADWLSRPVWLWPSIASESKLDSTLDARRPDPNIVFAEDASRFVPVSDAQRYSSDVEPPFKSRWIVAADTGIRYLPAARLVAS